MTNAEIITKAKLAEIDLPNVYVAKTGVTITGVDPTHEYIHVWFRDGNDNLPDQIEVVSVNNSVDIVDPDTMTWDILQLAIYMCFGAASDGPNEPIQEFSRQLPVAVTVSRLIK